MFLQRRKIACIGYVSSQTDIDTLDKVWEPSVKLQMAGRSLKDTKKFAKASVTRKWMQD